MTTIRMIREDASEGRFRQVPFLEGTSISDKAEKPAQVTHGNVDLFTSFMQVEPQRTLAADRRTSGYDTR